MGKAKNRYIKRCPKCGNLTVAKNIKCSCGNDLTDEKPIISTILSTKLHYTKFINKGKQKKITALLEEIKRVSNICIEKYFYLFEDCVKENIKLKNGEDNIVYDKIFLLQPSVKQQELGIKRFFQAGDKGIINPTKFKEETDTWLSNSFLQKSTLPKVYDVCYNYWEQRITDNNIGDIQIPKLKKSKAQIYIFDIEYRDIKEDTEIDKKKCRAEKDIFDISISLKSLTDKKYTDKYKEYNPSIGNEDKDKRYTGLKLFLKRSRHFNTLYYQRGILNNSIILTDSYIQFSFEVPKIRIKPKEGDVILGIDTNCNHQNLFTTSEGIMLGAESYETLQKLGISRRLKPIDVKSKPKRYKEDKTEKVVIRQKWDPNNPTRKKTKKQYRDKVMKKGSIVLTTTKRNVSKRFSALKGRFISDVCHTLKELIKNTEADIIVLEDMEGIKFKSRKKYIGVDKSHPTRKFRSIFQYFPITKMHQYIDRLGDKYNKRVVHVNPANTSNTCNICGTKHNKEDYKNGYGRLKQSIFKCKNCGAEINADINASKNIKNRGYRYVFSDKYKNAETKEENKNVSA